jgi:hypothetical protein
MLSFSRLKQRFAFSAERLLSPSPVQLLFGSAEANFETSTGRSKGHGVVRNSLPNHCLGKLSPSYPFVPGFLLSPGFWR